jgi:hypothetical protein
MIGGLRRQRNKDDRTILRRIYEEKVSQEGRAAYRRARLASSVFSSQTRGKSAGKERRPPISNFFFHHRVLFCD